MTDRMMSQRSDTGAPTCSSRGNTTENESRPGLWTRSELLSGILDAVADGIAAHDASGQLIFINDAGARMCGYESPGVAIAAPPEDFRRRVLVFDERGILLRDADLPGPLAARGMVVPERLVRIVFRTGFGERWISVKATPILDRLGLVRMSISIFRDVTRERRAEEERDRVLRELESERARLAAAVEALRDLGGAAPPAADRVAASR